MPGIWQKPGLNWIRGRIYPVLIATLLLFPVDLVFAQAPYKGRFVAEVLMELRQAGAPLVYSSNLVTPDLVVMNEPTANDLVLIASEILTPHDLSLESEEGMYIVVRFTPPDAESGVESTDQEGTIDPKGNTDAAAEQEIIMVSASRYVLQSTSQFFIDQRAIQALPDLGDDPLRAAHRLPGTAAGGLSSKSHFRGGEHNETAIYLNGLQLLEPFHIRDYHSIFSSIDSRAIAGVEAYTGGFPVMFGDHMSGVLALESQAPEESRHTELGLSVYNTSILHSGFSKGGQWDWLISARDSNLDLVLKPSLGIPDYFDTFARLGRHLSDRTYMSFNALYAKDSVVVTTEDDPTELEQSDSDTENQHYWARWQTEWRPDLVSSTVFSFSSFENLRVAEVNDPEQMTSRVRDWRATDVWGLNLDMQWTGLAGHDIRWGIDYQYQSANYRYAGFAVYDGFLSELAGLENPREYQVEAQPEGHKTSLYLTDRMSMTDATWLQLGLRWDRQTWTDPRFSNQLSPRASLLHQVDDNTDIRVSIGRFYQSQAAHQLQVEDNIDHFFAPQRSDHFIVGLRRKFSGGYRLRTELFLKQYDRLKPRFENLFDPLALIPEMAPDRVRLDPTGGEAKGFEVSLERRTDQELDWWVSYVWSRTSDKIDGQKQDRSWDQRHAIQAGVSWQRDQWNVGVAMRVHTGWPTTPLIVDYDPEKDEYSASPGERNSENYSTFFTLDFRVSREFEVKIGRLNAFLEISNATNRDNPCCTDYDIDDEVVPAVLDQTEDYWVPIIPAIGILWEF
ncbi:MAG TPA: TonB-dependent receptor [Xanthomonadales bacterium]|nr:TonB-dependent receptor [Xanthomonadales bacterium]